MFARTVYKERVRGRYFRLQYVSPWNEAPNYRSRKSSASEILSVEASICMQEANQTD